MYSKPSGPFLNMILISRRYLHVEKTPRCHWHRWVRLYCVMDTPESSSIVSLSLWSQAQRCHWHRGVQQYQGNHEVKKISLIFLLVFFLQFKEAFKKKFDTAFFMIKHSDSAVSICDKHSLVMICFKWIIIWKVFGGTRNKKIKFNYF